MEGVSVAYVLTVQWSHLPVIDQMYFDFDNMYGMAHIDT